MSKLSYHCTTKGLACQSTCLMDDANIVPLLVSNTTYWWNSRKSFMSLRMHHMMDVARDYLIGKCSYITQYKTLMERESYCNFLDTEGYQILGQIGSSE